VCFLYEAIKTHPELILKKRKHEVNRLKKAYNRRIRNFLLKLKKESFYKNLTVLPLS